MHLHKITKNFFIIFYTELLLIIVIISSLFYFHLQYTTGCIKIYSVKTVLLKIYINNKFSCILLSKKNNKELILHIYSIYGRIFVRLCAFIHT